MNEYTKDTRKKSLSWIQFSRETMKISTDAFLTNWDSFNSSRKIDREYKEFETTRADYLELQKRFETITRPILIVEGDRDLKTLQTAWDCLYIDPMPFEIRQADGESKLGNLAAYLLSVPSSRQVVVLFDHDLAGITRFNSLKKTWCDTTVGYRFVLADIMIMTLCPPRVPDRREQARNKNLTMEFYIEDSFLCSIDRASGNQLFARDKWINDGKHTDIDEESLKFLLDNEKKSIVHLALNRNGKGKAKLVESLPDLPDKDFMPFHGLFRIIVNHLEPKFVLVLKPHLANNQIP